jgi:hypothetical protein
LALNLTLLPGPLYVTSEGFTPDCPFCRTSTGVRRSQWGETLHLVSDLDCEFLAFDAKYWCKSCQKDKHQAADALLNYGPDDGTDRYQNLAAAAALPYNWHTTDPVFLERLAETHPWAALATPFVGTEKCKVTPTVANLIAMNMENPTKLAADIKELRCKAFDVRRTTYASLAKYLYDGQGGDLVAEEDEEEEEGSAGGKALPPSFTRSGFSSRKAPRSGIKQPPRPPTEKEYGIRHLSSKWLRGFFKVQYYKNFDYDMRVRQQFSWVTMHLKFDWTRKVGLRIRVLGTGKVLSSRLDAFNEVGMPLPWLVHFTQTESLGDPGTCF